ETLREALRGRIKSHHRFLLRLHMQQIAALEAAIAEIDRELDAGLACFRDAVERLSTIPGISQLSAQVIVSEISTDMSRFATDATPAVRARLVPTKQGKGGQASATPPAQRSTMAQGRAGAMRLGCHAQQRHLLARPVRPIASSPRAKESHLRSRRLDPHR